MNALLRCLLRTYHAILPIYRSTIYSIHSEGIELHMNHRFEVIFFDLGDTLMYDKDPWDPIFPRADAAMRRCLEQAGYPLDKNAYGEFNTIFDMYYHRRRDTVQEETTVQLLRELMDSQGASPPDPVLFAAMEAMYAVTQENWFVEEDAAPTLKTLQEMGYRLGHHISTPQMTKTCKN